MAIAGAGFGASQALEKILADQMVKAQIAQRERENAERMALEQQRLAETKRQFDVRAAADDTERRDRNNVRGLDLMKADKADMDLDAAVSTLPPHLKPISGLMRVGALGKLSPDDLQSPEQRATDAKADEERQIRIRNATRAPQQPQEKKPLMVKMPDGSIKDFNNVLPPGAVPYDQVAARSGRPETEAAVEAMKAYGDDMLSVLDSLIDEQGNLKPEVAGVIGSFDGSRPEWAYLSEGSQSALANLDRLQSMLNINVLRDMKNQSRTGATGFGALSERELNVVESSSSKLRRRRQGDAEYAAELKRLRDAIMVGRAGGIGTQQPTTQPDAASAAALALIEKARNARKPQR